MATRNILVLFFTILAMANAFDLFGWVNCSPSQKGLLQLSSVLCPCPIQHNYIERLEQALKEVFGQEEAKALVLDRIRAHNFENSAKQPTVFHFAGDNGVGKTWVAHLLAAALYKPQHKLDVPSGLLYIRGNTYRDKSVIQKAKIEIRSRIIQHLQKCPRAVIVIDEAELIHPDDICIFQEFLDTTHPQLHSDGIEVVLTQAIYIFITDFGAEGQTEGMTLDDIRALVHKEALHSWQDSRQTAFVSYIVPFAPVSERGRRDLINHRLLKLETEPKIQQFKAEVNINISPASREKLWRVIGEQCRTEVNIYKNYRGVDEIFDSMVLYPILQHLQNHPSEKTPRSLTIVMEGPDNKLVVKEQDYIHKPDL